jgi:hypothetical protein
MHDVFHANCLRKASTDPLPGQVEPEEQLIKINGHPKWLVQEILNSRLFYGRLQYKVSWVAHDLDPTWYNAHGFIGAPHKVRDYYEAYLEKAGPLARLSLWLQAYEADEALEVTDEDDKVARKPRTVHRLARRK